VRVAQRQKTQEGYEKELVYPEHGGRPPVRELRFVSEHRCTTLWFHTQVRRFPVLRVLDQHGRSCEGESTAGVVSVPSRAPVRNQKARIGPPSAKREGFQEPFFTSIPKASPAGRS
jgi:hypothetical protein